MTQPDEKLRALVKTQLDEVAQALNSALRGQKLDLIKPILARLGRGEVLPHWFEQLSSSGTLPNLDGKTIGSVVEMLFVAIIETQVIPKKDRFQLRVNPARGVDLPDLNLGIKSPSENYCTSEPFYSAYERLLGNEYDVVVLLTDYQSAKRSPPLRLQLIGAKYLSKTQIADRNLCAIGRAHRAWLVSNNESNAKRFFKFLAFINQSDWLAKQLLKLVEVLDDENTIESILGEAELDFERTNQQRVRRFREPVSEIDLQALMRIRTVSPRFVGVLQAADDWVIENWKEAGRGPNANEWERLKYGPLDGAIGMSFALQWRYNFGSLFERGGDDAD